MIAVVWLKGYPARRTRAVDERGERETVKDRVLFVKTGIAGPSRAEVSPIKWLKSRILVPLSFPLSNDNHAATLTGT